MIALDDDDIHALFRKLATIIADEKGIIVQQVQFSWIDVSTAEKQKSLVNTVEVTSHDVMR